MGTPLADPVATLIVPVHSRKYLHMVMGSLERQTRRDFEVLVVDDASPAESTGAMLASWAARDARVRVISLEENVGYLRAVNAGAAEAAGAVLVLLNNDTEPQAGWLEALLSTFTQHPEAGVVGARLLDPDGTLQDAGGVVFSDGSATNLGRGETAGLPAFSFLRPVLYCTAAALATPRALWEEVGGFDERFVPAYYEDVDYCFAVRALGRSVLIQPDAIVVHKEGQSHGTDTGTGIKAHQVENQARFAQKWAAELARFGPRPEAPDAVAARKIQMMGRL